MIRKIMIDFQEAAEELKADFIQSAYAELDGRLWKMKKHKGTIAFFAKIEGQFHIMLPKPDLYFLKWQPVRDK